MNITIKEICRDCGCPRTDHLDGRGLCEADACGCMMFRFALRKPEPQADLHPQTQMEPTPRPWSIAKRFKGPFFSIICENGPHDLDTICEVNANLPDPEAIANTIVRAVNSFDDLLEALKRLLAHSCIADAHSEDKEAEDHRAESFARSVIAKIERKP